MASEDVRLVDLPLAADRLLVCVSPSPTSSLLLHGAAKLAESLHSEWLAVFVETPASLRLGASERERVAAHLRLAESLGAETTTLRGEHGPEAIVAFAKQRKVSRILVGKPTHSRLLDRVRPSFLDGLVRASGGIDVHVLADAGASLSPISTLATNVRGASPLRARVPWLTLAGALASFGFTALATVIGRWIFGLDQTADIVMIYLFGIALVSLRWGLGASLLTTALAILSFDFFFVPPYLTFAVLDLRHVVTFAVMLTVGVIISGLTKRIKDQAAAASSRELRTANLYALSRGLASAKASADVVLAGERHLRDTFGAGASVVLAQDAEEDAATTVDDGRTTKAPLSKDAIWLPLDGAEGRIGRLGVDVPLGALDHEQKQHLETVARQIAAALERTRLAEQAASARLQVEAEQLRNSLLSSVSHDLRTPLAVITGTASTLLDGGLGTSERKEMTEAIVVEADRLSRLVRNLLDMTRIEAGPVRVNKEWQPLEEAVGAALERVEPVIGERKVETRLPADLPLVPFDSLLLQQVLVNLLENALKYTPEGSPLAIEARAGVDEVEVAVLDRGPGLASGDEQRVFEKFYRAERSRGGVGLGLTICRGIIAAHGGKISAANREGGGAAFTFTLPIEGEPPRVDLPELPAP